MKYTDLNDAVVGLLMEKERQRARMIKDLSNRLMGDDLEFLEEMVRKANALDFLMSSPEDRDPDPHPALFVGRCSTGDMYCNQYLTDDEALSAIEAEKADVFQAYKELNRE